ncbi:tRNA threonylcarbamoyladenosine dehydratase [Facklamia miroungae]|uniref:tRNA A37 threonylcarbamoyladenosine dehydratase n=1 Tax=Facklamia miroungae TaxID=120956 RepID=A0A1G7QFP9_9LACT|nr:tRNA threonylcarbamoyladenosine dehydratase [Facklamia miroungae]NKZ28925.1 tRNA threonylcarbamoyladenosine dehydratase [Facklamia miroungae]SDF97363.1 tRNA A37 threonylcarbamoyladenosine dehydratase [Facklamia miroungae]
MEKKIPARLSRLSLLLKEEGLTRLAQSRVMVLGLGGVGSACAEALARGGVGYLILFDGDIIEESNINRQALAFSSTVGKAKTDVMRAMVKEINPECQVDAQQIFLTKENIKETLKSFPRPDYVIDCIDTISQKLEVAAFCQSEKIPLLSSMGAANKLDPAYLKFSKIENTSYCPMSKIIRLECRRRDIKGLEVLYSNEQPFKVQDPDGNTKAQTLGSMSYMPPIMGMMLAGKVIRRLAGIEDYKIW